VSRLSELRWPLAFSLTAFCTITWAGAFHWVNYQYWLTGHPPNLYSLDAFEHGLWFTLGLFGMLVCHEGAHMLVAHWHGLKIRGPFILPAPFQLIGTLGGFFKLESPYQSRVQMIDVASAGPIAGFVWCAGLLFLSRDWILSAPLTNTNLIRFGVPMIIRLMHPAKGIILHPLPAGCWLGCLVTMVNLLTFEHFDGGTILHGLFPKAARIGSVAMFAAAFFFAGATIWGGSTTWAIALGVALLVLLTAGFQPDPPNMDQLPMRSYVLAGLCAICLVLSWTRL
jgi:hypothetical protein